QQRGGKRACRIERGGSLPCEACPRDDAPHQRKSVGMEARRRQTEDKVPWLQYRPRQQRPAFGGAHREAGDVEISRGVQTGPLRRLSADQRASRLCAPFRDALHHRRRRVFVKLTGSKIIQEKQWLSALND